MGMSLTEDYRAVRNRLRNPVNGHVSDERQDVISAEKHRQKRIEQIRVAAEAKHEADLKRQWANIAERLQAQAELHAIELERKRREERERGILSIDTIQKVICAWFNLTVASMVSERRTLDVIYPRQLAMFLCRHHTTASYPKIAKRFGGRDHTTVMASVNKITTLIEQGHPDVVEDIVRLRRALGVEGK
jgi:chromosomal replication initiation ATPase DnaA